MASKKTRSTKKSTVKDNIQDDFTSELISQINKAHNEKIAFNLGTDDAPTHIKRWIPTGSKQLDFIIANQLNGGLPEGRIIEIQGPTSCHAAGDRVLLADGRTIPVELVRVGDKLLGPDGTERVVLECHRGTDELYKILPHEGGKEYTVNQHHLLHLQKDGCDNQVHANVDETINIPVKDYVLKPASFKEGYKQKRVGIDSFPGRNKVDLPIPPYVLGLIVADECLEKGKVSLETKGEFIKNVFYDAVRRFENSNKTKTFEEVLTSLELLGTKSEERFIPEIYKLAPIRARQDFIAGMIDRFGSINNGRFEITLSSKSLIDDFIFVCSSVGLHVAVKDHNNKPNCLVISGPVDTIPTGVRVIDEKSRTSSSGQQPCSLTGITVRPVGRGEYYGFSVDKDNLYLTDDFSVFHNSGKSHIAFEIAKSTQRMGGIVVYIDTENATSLQNLMQLGIDVKRRFVFVQTACTEDIFQVCEETILKARAMVKDVPVTIIWDSVAASSPKAELEGAYDKDIIGVQPRVLGRGLRKITNIIGNQNVCMVLINQQRVKIGVMFGDPTTTPGGNAIPYASSVRLKISSSGQKQITDKDGNIIGIHVKVKTIKNKVSRPFRECSFQIHFGVGIREHEEVFDLFRQHCASLPKGTLGIPCGEDKKELVMIEGTGAWKTFTVTDAESGEVIIEKKFYKQDFDKILYDPQYSKYMDTLYVSALTMHSDATEHPTFVGINASSVEEATAKHE